MDSDSVFEDEFFLGNSRFRPSKVSISSGFKPLPVSTGTQKSICGVGVPGYLLHAFGCKVECKFDFVSDAVRSKLAN